MIKFTSRGSFTSSESFLKRMSRGDIFSSLDKYGAQGVQALASATPVDSGVTASSWSYQVKRTRNSYSIEWINSHIEEGVPIAIILQYGHGTGTGGYVQGQDYITQP